MPTVPRSVPHPFPYQGSKRTITGQILPHLPAGLRRLVEPFCGSAAVSLAAAVSGRATEFWLNDANGPLVALWRAIQDRPMQLANLYEALWREQASDRKAFFFQVREKFNQTHEPHLLLYLLARIVKGSVRYGTDGRFNQSADNRRAGMRPNAMRAQLVSVSAVLSGRAKLSALDFRHVVEETSTEDVIYMDPPYQGTSFTRDHRYFDGLSYADFVDVLQALNGAGKSYIVSYDGETGDKRHGATLPEHLDLRHLWVPAGRSSQSTLLGRNCQTVESLYLSPALCQRLGGQPSGLSPLGKQDELAFA